MQENKCALCKKDTILKKSHFLPQSIYKKLKKLNQAKNIALMPSANKESSKAIPLAKEITTNLLCGDCENKFSQNGESWFSEWANIDTDDTGKPKPSLLMLEIMKKINEPDIHKKDILNKKDELKLVYFLLSMFWRGCYDWTNFKKYEIPNKIKIGIENFLSKNTLSENNFDEIYGIDIYVDLYILSPITILPYYDSNDKEYIFCTMFFVFRLKITNKKRFNIFYGGNLTIGDRITKIFNERHKNSCIYGNNMPKINP